MQEDIRDDANDHDHEADGNETTHEREVTLAGHGVASESQKDDRRAAQCGAYHLRAIRQGEVHADDGSESETQQTRNKKNDA